MPYLRKEVLFCLVLSPRLLALTVSVITGP